MTATPPSFRTIIEPFRDQLDGRRDLVRLPDDLDRIAELAADPGAEQVMVVY